jgi:hypothetical protein
MMVVYHRNLRFHDTTFSEDLMSSRTELVATVVLVVTIAANVTLALRAGGDQKADEVMAAARKALGGEQKILVVKSLSLRAEYRREMSGPGMGGGGGTTFVMMGGGGGSVGGGGQMTGKIEIDLELPDKYLRSDIGTSGFAITRTEGFEASRPFVEVAANSPGVRVQSDNPATDPVRAKAALRRSNGELARLMLGLVAGTHPSFPVTYTYAGQAESPDGKADVVDVAGPEDFKVRLYVDAASHLPLMLTYVEPEPRMVTRTMSRDGASGASGGHVVAPGGGAAAQLPANLTSEQRAEIEKKMREAEAEAEKTPRKMIEYRLFFSEYREVDGLSLPHRIARGTGDKTTEEWDIKSYKVNPSFKADHFKIGS